MIIADPAQLLNSSDFATQSCKSAAGLYRFARTDLVTGRKRNIAGRPRTYRNASARGVRLAAAAAATGAGAPAPVHARGLRSAAAGRAGHHLPATPPARRERRVAPPACPSAARASGGRRRRFSRCGAGFSAGAGCARAVWQGTQEHGFQRFRVGQVDPPPNVNSGRTFSRRSWSARCAQADAVVDREGESGVRAGVGRCGDDRMQRDRESTSQPTHLPTRGAVVGNAAPPAGWSFGGGDSTGPAADRAGFRPARRRSYTGSRAAGMKYGPTRCSVDHHVRQGAVVVRGGDPVVPVSWPPTLAVDGRPAGNGRLDREEGLRPAARSPRGRRPARARRPMATAKVRGPLQRGRRRRGGRRARWRRRGRFV